MIVCLLCFESSLDGKKSVAARVPVHNLNFLVAFVSKGTFTRIILFYLIVQPGSFHYVSSLSFRSLLFATSHGPRFDFTPYTIQISNKGTYFINGYITLLSTTGLESSYYNTSSSSDTQSGFEAHAATCRQKISWHPRSQATFRLKRTRAFFRPSR